MTEPAAPLPTLPYVGPERRDPTHFSECAHAPTFNQRFDDGAKRMDAFEADLKLNTEKTLEIHSILTAAKGAFKVLGWLGVIFKWVGAIGSGCVAVYVLWYALTHGGDLPKGSL